MEETIDLTPSWSGIVRVMLEIYAEQRKKTPQPEITEEFIKMAKLADRCNAIARLVQAGLEEQENG